jgi:hypothetical protein
MCEISSCEVSIAQGLALPFGGFREGTASAVPKRGLFIVGGFSPRVVDAKRPRAKAAIGNRRLAARLKPCPPDEPLRDC